MIVIVPVIFTLRRGCGNFLFETLYILVKNIKFFIKNIDKL